MPSSPPIVMSEQLRKAAETLIQLALVEDLGTVGDITSKTVIPAQYQGKAAMVARVPGVLAGVELVKMVCQAVDPALQIDLQLQDGETLKPGDHIATVTGPLRSLLSAERTALNFIQRLSGIASLTRKYVDLVQSTSCKVLDTRKTLPGWRLLDKYAVACGGGTNHRIGLFDAIMIKDNHLAGLREHQTPLSEAVKLANEVWKGKAKVEVEVDSIKQLKEALSAKPDIILLDNMKPAMLKEAVVLRNQLQPTVKLEASGGINLQTVAEVAATGVDFVSVGALTHSAPALDIALDYIE